MKSNRTIFWIVGVVALVAALAALYSGRPFGTHTTRETDANQIASASEEPCLVAFVELEGDNATGRATNVCKHSISSGRVEMQVTNKSDNMVIASPIAYVSNLAPNQTAQIDEYAARNSEVYAQVKVVRTQAF